MIQHEVLAYEADGLAMRGHLYFDDGVSGKRPGVLVYPEGPGLGGHAKAKAEALAKDGYVALACDLHGNEHVATGMDEIMGLLGPLMQDPACTRARARGGMEALLTRPEVDNRRIAAIGFCFGGTMALELARSGAAIGAAVGFHSGLATASPAQPGVVKARILACIGADDPGIGPEVRAAFEQEMRAAGVDWRLHVYGGVVHSFTNPEAAAMGRPEFARYDAGADARSHREMLALFDEVFAA